MKRIFPILVVSCLFGQGVTGDWGGIRKKLEKKGITVSSSYGTDVMGNAMGGKRKRMEYAGFFDAALAFDFEKIGGPQGLSLVISNYILSGQNLSNSVGSYYTIQEVFSSGNYFLGEVKFSWSTPQEKLTFEWGRLFAGDVFATNDLWQYYVSSGVNANLESIEGNIFFPSFNIAAWAIRASVHPNENISLLGAIYNADPKVQDIDKHGAYFPLNTKYGYLALFQGTFQHRGSYPGSISIGGYYVSSEFQEIQNPQNIKEGKTGGYLIFDQVIFSKKDKPVISFSYRNKAKEPSRKLTVTPDNHAEGLTIWGAGYYAPDSKVNLQKYQLSGGILYKGFFSGRSEDVSAFGVIAGKFNKKGQKVETVIEVNHRFQMGSLFYLTPDLQYILSPSGISSIPSALVLGIEACVNF